MKRVDAYFPSVGNNFCCSEHFLLNDVQSSTQIEIGSRPLPPPPPGQTLMRSLCVEREDVRHLGLVKTK